MVFELTDSSGTVGLIMFSWLAPFLFIAPISGSWLDRVDRRRVAIVFGILSVIFTFTIAILILLNVTTLWIVVFFTVLQAIALSIIVITQEALLPSLVKKEDLLSAVAISRTAHYGPRLAGPLLGGIFLAAFGPEATYFFTGVLMIFSLIAVWKIKTRIKLIPKSDSFFAIGTELIDGFRYSWSDRRNRLFLALLSCHCGFTMAFDSQLPRLVTELGAGSELLTAIFVGIGLGAIMATGTLTQLRRVELVGAVFVIVSVGSGISLLILGAAPNMTVAIIGAILMGATQGPFMAFAASSLQSVAPEEMRGRIMSQYFMAAAGTMALMNLGFGYLADFIDVRMLLIVTSIVWMLAFLFAWNRFSYVKTVASHGNLESVATSPVNT